MALFCHKGQEHLEHVGCFLEHFARCGRNKLLDFFTELGPNGPMKLLLGQRANVRCPALAANDVGDLVPDKLAHVAPHLLRVDIMPEVSDVADPLALGQRIVAVLETGRRTATYKLATLMALMDHCIEHLPADADAELDVPIRDLAERVLEIYWPQVRPFEGSLVLRQSAQPVARILVQTERLRSATAVSGGGLEWARLRAPAVYEQVVTDVALTLAQQPLHRLQHLGASGRGPTFLYDDSWLHDHLSAKQLAAHHGQLTLYSGVAAALSRLSGLLRPTLEVLWIEDVRRMNKGLMADVPDLAGHLFGRDRISLDRPRAALADAFGARCFYCNAAVGRSAPVDHVLPWSRVGLDGLSNLVLSCSRCNGDKSETLPVMPLVSAAVNRDTAVMEKLATEIAWPTQRSRIVAVADGLYRAQPEGTPLWSRYGNRLLLDLQWINEWRPELGVGT